MVVILGLMKEFSAPPRPSPRPGLGRGGSGEEEGKMVKRTMVGVGRATQRGFNEMSFFPVFSIRLFCQSVYSRVVTCSNALCLRLNVFDFLSV